jgi:hypothetical protein
MEREGGEREVGGEREAVASVGRERGMFIFVGFGREHGPAGFD